MHETTRAQIRVVREVVSVLRDADVAAWLFGGWGLDARIGRITRRHGDVEFWIDRSDGGRATSALIAAGAVVLDTQPPEESCEFTWNGVPFSTAYFDRQPNGTFATKGRWSDWVFPAGSFDDVPGELDGTPVSAMSSAGMLAMKEQYSTLRNGGPLRDKDLGDIEILRALCSRVDD